MTNIVTSPKIIVKFSFRNNDAAKNDGHDSFKRHR